MTMKKISTWLWFDTEAEEAAHFYTSVFRKARVGEIDKAPAGGEPYTREGQVLTVEFEIEGQQFVGLNGGKQDFTYNESVSFQILCADQAELDEYWSKLIADGGAEIQCGWCKDKYGVRWQIVPEILPNLMNGPDRERAGRVNAAMLKMVKFDVAALEAA